MYEWASAWPSNVILGQIVWRILDAPYMTFYSCLTVRTRFGLIRLLYEIWTLKTLTLIFQGRSSSNAMVQLDSPDDFVLVIHRLSSITWHKPSNFDWRLIWSSKSLKVKYKAVVGFRAYSFLLMCNNNHAKCERERERKREKRHLAIWKD